MNKNTGAIKKSVSFSQITFEKVDNYMKESGLGLSQFINMAVIQYLDQKEAMAAMNNINVLMEKIDELQKSKSTEDNEKDSKKWGW